MSTYLVTGSVGFIGSRVVEMLISDGHNVVGIDNINDYYDIRLKDYRLSKLLNDEFILTNSSKKSFYENKKRLSNKKFEFINVDIENKIELQNIFNEFKIDAVFNLAARAGVRYSMENPDVYLSTNTLGTLNILECMKTNDVNKLILASTSSLYAGQKMPFNEELPVNSPLTPYAVTKKAAELMAYSYHHLYGIDVSVVRYFTVFGPAGRPDMCIFRFMKWIDEEIPLQVFGDGFQSRDFTYIDDIARGTIQAVKNIGYEIINLGGGNEPVSLNWIINFISEKMGNKKFHKINKDFHIADIQTTQANINKAKRLLDFKSKVTIEEGLNLTLDWYKQNRHWLKHTILC
jgi:nucleoside-diphosphate-sugar epimerase